MTQEVIVRPSTLELTPEAVVAGATVQAKLLMDIVEKTECYQEISGKKYLQVEAWETIGAFNRTHAETESIIPIVKEDEIIGYQAHVQLWKDGIVVGGSIMPCYFTENCCKGREGDAKHKSAMSAAQTFATSKAYRMNFSYVAILAGYQPTPAEEMTGEVSDDRPANLEHWCEKHQTKFFKRGKMSRYAHPIDDTKEWCNEPEPSPQATSSTPDNATSTPVKEEGKGKVSVKDKPVEMVGKIDKAWLIESINKLKWDILKYLKDTYHIVGTAKESLFDVIVKLSTEQQEALVKEIQDRVGML